MACSRTVIARCRASRVITDRLTRSTPCTTCRAIRTWPPLSVTAVTSGARVVANSARLPAWQATRKARTTVAARCETDESSLVDSRRPRADARGCRSSGAHRPGSWQPTCRAGIGSTVRRYRGPPQLRCVAAPFQIPPNCSRRRRRAPARIRRCHGFMRRATRVSQTRGTRGRLR
jgi:hypothetical protein